MSQIYVKYTYVLTYLLKIIIITVFTMAYLRYVAHIFSEHSLCLGPVTVGGSHFKM